MRNKFHTDNPQSSGGNENSLVNPQILGAIIQNSVARREQATLIYAPLLSYSPCDPHIHCISNIFNSI